MAKKVLTLTVIAFGVFFLLSQPAVAADSVKVAAGAVGEAFESVARFFTSLLH